MKGFYIYSLILEVVLLYMGDCKITSDEVYVLLSQRLNLENRLLRNELKELKAVVQKQDEKIAALGLSARRTPETEENANKNHQDLENQITVIQHAFQNEKELVRGIQSYVSGLESELEKKIATVIKSSTSELKSNLQIELAAEIKTSTLEPESTPKKEDVNGLKSSISALESKLARQKVAFSAGLNQSTSELAIGSTIVFDEIVYQDGNGYNSTDGIFTCPETGVYMFSVVLHCWHGKEGVKSLAARLMVASKEKSCVVSESRHSQHNDQASNLVILSVKQGQRVWVEIFDIPAARVFRTFSTFSGALLYN